MRKTKKVDTYSKELLSVAKESVRSKLMTISSASRTYNITRATLYDHINGRRGGKSTTMGRQSALPLDVEKKLAELLKTMDKYGYGLSQIEVFSLVVNYINGNKLVKTPFKGGFPNQDWWIGFSSRHKLSL